MVRVLYLPNKYRVTVGNGTAGFCTVWSDPELVLRQMPGVLDLSAIIGTLYSREGVNVILRNLALNPDIRHLVIWGNGPLSKTPFGVMGAEILRALWQNGLDENGIVKGTNFPLHREFDFGVIRKLVEHVELVDLSGKDLPAAADTIRALRADGTYMQPQTFPEHKPAEGQPAPSEVVGFLIRGKTIAEAWTRVVDRIMRYGIVKETEYGNKQRELIAVNWVIESERTDDPQFPDVPDELKQVIGASREAIERYYPEFMSAELPTGTAYTYGQRLWDYGREERKHVSQIEKIIEHLKESPVTRRAVATTWNQYVDSDKGTKNPPCFVTMQVIQTDGKLHLLATFRSHDIFKAAIPNAFGLRKLQEYISNETGFEVGSLLIISNSAHIYEEDWDNARKYVKCTIWEREPRIVFDQNLDTDPRGIVLIRIEGAELVAEVGTTDGGVVASVTGKTAKQIYKKLAELDLLSRADHMMDIAAELQKAEIARDLGIAYAQDQPLRLPTR